MKLLHLAVTVVTLAFGAGAMACDYMSPKDASNKATTPDVATSNVQPAAAAASKPLATVPDKSIRVTEKKPAADMASPPKSAWFTRTTILADE